MNMKLASMSRAARWLRHALTLAVLLLVAANIWLWWHGSGQSGERWLSVAVESSSALQAYPLVSMVTVSLASLVLLGGLCRLWRLMRLFEANEFFSVAAAGHLRGFALALMLAVLVDVVAPPLLLLLARLAGAGVTALVAQLDAGDLMALLVGVLLWQVTSIMAEARRLAEDNAQIV